MCDSSAEYLELYICALSFSGVVNSVVLNVWKVILDTTKPYQGCYLSDLVNGGACFRKPHNISVRVRNVEVKPLIPDGTPALAGY